MMLRNFDKDVIAVVYGDVFTCQIFIEFRSLWKPKSGRLPCRQSILIFFIFFSQKVKTRKISSTTFYGPFEIMYSILVFLKKYTLGNL